MPINTLSPLSCVLCACSGDSDAAATTSWLHLFTFTSIASLMRLLLYALLDLYWALYQHSWPLTLCFYLPFCIPLELAFYIQVQRFLRERSRAPNMIFGGPIDSAEAQRAWENLVNNEPPHVVDEALRGWFVGRGAPKAHDVLDLIALTTYNQPADALRPDQLGWVHNMLHASERAIGRRFAPGRNHRLRSMAFFGFEGLEPCWKPLLFYLCTQTCQGACHLILRYLGFERREAGSLKYWYRPPTPEPETVAARASRHVMRWAGAAAPPPPPPPLPLVFLHGVGGLAPYWLLLVLAARRHKGSIVVPMFPHCSLSCLPVLASAPRPPSPEELAAAVREMVYACGFRHASFLSHSFGTAALGALVKAAPDLCAAVTFVDPICFCFSGTVAHNFLYAKPRPPMPAPTLLRRDAWPSSSSVGSPRLAPTAEGEGDGGAAGSASDDEDEFDDAASVASAASCASAATDASWTHYAQRKIATEEPTIQDAFRRRFWWAQNWLHPSDLPCDAHVILSGLDTVASANEVRRHLKDYNQMVQREAVISPSSVTGRTSPAAHAGSAGSAGLFHKSGAVAAGGGATASGSGGAIATPGGGLGSRHPLAARQASPLLTVEYHATWRHGWLLMHPHCLRKTIGTLTARAEQFTPPPLPVASAGGEASQPGSAAAASPLSPLSPLSSPLRASAFRSAGSSPLSSASGGSAPSSTGTAASVSTPAHRASRLLSGAARTGSGSLAVEFATTWGTCGAMLGADTAASDHARSPASGGSRKARWLAEAEAGSRRAARAAAHEKELCGDLDDEASETASIVSSILTNEMGHDEALM